MNLFLEVNTQLLTILKLDRDLLLTENVRDVLSTMRRRIMEAYCVDAFVAYERYLDILSIRAETPALKDIFTLIGWDFFEQEFRKDPSRPEITIGVAMGRISVGDISRGRQLLRRIATSGFKERELARGLLSQLIS